MDAHKQNEQQKINEEAIAAGTTPERVRAQEGRKPVTPAAEQKARAMPEKLEDGRRDTQGSEFEPEQETFGEEQLADNDPSQSGVQPAPKKPGTRIKSPGREGQTAWSEQMQSGRPHLKNPAD